MEDIATSTRPSSPGNVWWAWVPVAIYCAVIFAASSISTGRLPVWKYDKLIHAGEYAVLGALLVRAFWVGPPRLGALSALAAAIALACVFGITDELHQTMTPGRIPSVGDAIADAVGATIGSALASGVLVWRRGNAGA